jgi:hypothetical protein
LKTASQRNGRREDVEIFANRLMDLVNLLEQQGQPADNKNLRTIMLLLDFISV